jgi:hypothetical protein
MLLVSGWLVFWAGAFTPPYRWWFGIPVREVLEMVDAHRGAWLFIAVSFTVGVLLTLAGLVALAGVLRAAGARLASDLGQTTFSVGAVLWLASLAFRATASVSAARETVATGVVPSWFEPLRAWSGALFAIYMVLAYLAIAAYGRALLQTALAPRWLARSVLIFGLVGAVGFIARVPVFAPPLMIHLPLGAVGLAILRGTRARTSAPAGG